MAVHAHPDDEVISTGGILAHYADEGVRTIVVTCTDGSQGYGPGGVMPGEPGHDRRAVAETRRAELHRSCAVLGVAHLEMLGYHDSGMAGWAGNEEPDAFCNVVLDEAAARVAELIERHEPQVVVTYDHDSGGYGHPDHVQAHRVTVAAFDRVRRPAKLYFTARGRSQAARMRELREQLGMSQRPGRPPRATPAGLPDDAITTVIDTRAALERKRAALEAHASQLADSFWVKLNDEDFAELFGEESFIRARDASGAPLPESDLFAGL
jgi:LmbE family N-acetylglucosaminyl deacetylase